MQIYLNMFYWNPSIRKKVIFITEFAIWCKNPPFYEVKTIFQKRVCAWNNFKIFFSRPLFIIIFKTKHYLQVHIPFWPEKYRWLEFFKTWTNNNSNLPRQKWLSQTIEIMSSDQNFVHILMQIHQSVINKRSHFQKGCRYQNRNNIIWCQFWFFLS